MKSTSKAAEQDLAQLAIEAHGGLERWKHFTTHTGPASLVNDGGHLRSKMDSVGKSVRKMQISAMRSS